jgi:hypothetical protein
LHLCWGDGPVLQGRGGRLRAVEVARRLCPVELGRREVGKHDEAAGVVVVQALDHAGGRYPVRRSHLRAAVRLTAPGDYRGLGGGQQDLSERVRKPGLV